MKNRFIQKSPSQFINAPLTSVVIDLSLVSLELDSREANNSVTKFLTDFLMTIKGEDLLTKSFLDSYANQLVNRLIHGILFSLPSYFIPDFSDVFFSLVSLERERIGNLIKEVFREIIEKIKKKKEEEEEINGMIQEIICAKHPKVIAVNLRRLRIIIC